MESQETLTSPSIQRIKEFETESTSLLKRVIKSYKNVRISERAAALAFFTLIALVPLLMFMVIGTQFVTGKDFAEHQVMLFIGDALGDIAPVPIKTLLYGNATAFESYIVTSIVSSLVILWSMTTVFLYLRKSLARIFSFEEIEGGLVQRTVKTRLLAILYMVILFLLLLLVMVLHSYVSSLLTLTAQVPLGPVLSPWITACLGVLISFLFALGFFGVVYRMISDRIHNNDALLGGLVAACCFTSINILFSVVLVSKTVLSLYGVLGVFIALGLYLYYLYMAFFIGALAARHHSILSSK